MGFLANSNALVWPSSVKYIEYIRDHGITQFLSIYSNYMHSQSKAFIWGDEIEFMIVHFDEDLKEVRLSLVADRVIEHLIHMQKDLPKLNFKFLPEYANYMVECTPGEPFSDLLSDFLKIESDMRRRREIINSALGHGDFVISIPNFPLLGVNDSIIPNTLPCGPISQSLYVPDIVINPHERFRTLTSNIRIRKGSNVSINVPIFMDKNTVYPNYEKLRAHQRDALDGHIYMDAMIFGMGMCCVQCTIQTRNVHQAMDIADHLAVLAPIMMAITAGTPIFRGLLADTDLRWDAISMSVDDRTPSELGINNSDPSVPIIPKSRYSSIDSFLGPADTFKPEYNDLKLVYDDAIYQRLINHGVELRLAQHIAHLFIRDPLVIYEDRIELDDSIDNDHFENIQSTNWQTIRFKPPPPGLEIGWRVEFRPMEIQMTDFENAAIVSFIVLLVRVIVMLGLNFYMPISLVDENIKRAHRKDALCQQKFYWRKDQALKKAMDSCQNMDACKYLNNIVNRERDDLSSSPSKTEEANPEGAESKGNNNDSPLYDEITINEIMNGSDSYPGILNLLRCYINHITEDQDVSQLLHNYIEFISAKASGELMTYAKWQRHFVMNHPAYKHDSVVSQEITYDMMNHILAVNKKLINIPELLGKWGIPCREN